MMNPIVEGFKRKAFIYDTAVTFLQGSVCTYNDSDPDKGELILADGDVTAHLEGSLYYCWTESSRLDVIDSGKLTCLMAPCTVKVDTDGYLANASLLENVPVKLGGTGAGSKGKLQLWETGVDDKDLIIGYVETKPDSSGVMHVRLTR